MPKKTSTESALLAAVLASPDDDLPRLVYADWCDENGDPDRAEFIRTEIEMAKLMPDRETAPNAQDALRFRPLEARAGELWEAKAEGWYPGLKRCAEECNTHRGFPYHIATSAARFVKHAADLFAVAPTINDVILDKLGKHAAALARCKAFAQVERLSFFETPFRRREAEAFFPCKHLHRLREFDIGFSDTQMGPEGAEALAACPSLITLELLNLHNHAIFDWGATGILWETKFATLQDIDFGNNGLTDEFVDAVLDMDHLNGLRVLDLAWNHLTPTAVARLSVADHLSGLEHLDLGSNPLQFTAADHLATATFTDSLQRLKLWGCSLGGSGTARLLAGPFTKLEELTLSNNTVVPGSVQALAGNGALRSLRTLVLANCRMTPATVAALSDVRSLPALRSLDLGHQPLAPHAVRALVAGKLLRTVETLDLEETGLTDTGLRAIASADLPNLKWLRVSGNSITDAGVRALVRSKTLTALESVWIHTNGLTAKGAAMLKERFGEDGCWV